MGTLAEFIKSRGIAMTAVRAPANPSMEQDPKSPMDHWRCTLVNADGRAMSCYFSMGPAHRGKEPAVAEVLDCLASDAAGVENSTGFEDWCAEYGYDTDSRRAEKTYKACREGADKLREFLGAQDFHQLLFHMERI